jgi:hypothetical protein
MPSNPADNLRSDNHLRQPRSENGQFLQQKPGPEIAPYLGKLDKRTDRAQAYYNKVESYLAHMGGPEFISDVEKDLCAEAAGLEVLLREYRTAFLANPTDADVDRWLGALGHFRRYCVTMGLRPRAHDITPTVDQYIERKRAEKSEAAA